MQQQAGSRLNDITWQANFQTQASKKKHPQRLGSLVSLDEIQSDLQVNLGVGASTPSSEREFTSACLSSVCCAFGGILKLRAHCTLLLVYSSQQKLKKKSPLPKCLQI